MKEGHKFALRESADFLIRKAKSCKTHDQLQIVRDMLENVILRRYEGQSELAHEYTRVDIEIRQKERLLHPNAIEVGEHCEN